MMKSALTLHLIFFSFAVSAQTIKGRFLPDKHSGCRVWVAEAPVDLRVSWSGPCAGGKAEGTGTLVEYAADKEVLRYEGEMRKGRLNGKGKLNYAGGLKEEGSFADGLLQGPGKRSFPGGGYAEGEFVKGQLKGNGRIVYGGEPARKLEGHFEDGEFLNLDDRYRQHLEKHITNPADSVDLYFGDGDLKQDFYFALVPAKPVKGVLVLLAGAWESAEYVLSSNRPLVQQSFDHQYAVLVPSLNRSLVLDDASLNLLNDVLRHAIAQYDLPRNRFVLGGFSAGGILALRYTELANENAKRTEVVPRMVFGVDPPVDLDRLYRSFERKLRKDPQAQEPAYGIQILSKAAGGSPDQFPQKFVQYSAYSRENGGNARYLKEVPVRIYCDVDVNWWLNNRGADLYDINAPDLSALINFLHGAGNARAEFINAFGKGYRPEGTRHPHSWSLIDPEDCIRWMQQYLGE